MDSFRVHLMSPDSLSDDLISVWRSHQAADPNLRAPFFTPDYVRVVASARPDVSVAVIETAGQPPAFLPFHRDAAGVARPVGLRACDFSGLIASPGYAWSPRALIRACDLAGWDFTNVVTSDAAMRPYFRSRVESPFVSLDDGFDGFVTHCARSRSDLVKSIAQKTRKLSREIAPMRFEAHVPDRSALNRLFEWKAEQRKRTGTFDVLGTSWMRNVAARLLHTTTETFAGLLSVVYAGDQIAAVHLGMRSDTIWHYWFAAYNHDLQRYSPGLINLMEMIRAAPALGVQTMTLGRGDEPYKLRFATGATQLASGSVDCRLRRRLSNAIWYAARRASQYSPAVAALAKSVQRSGRRIFSANQ